MESLRSRHILIKNGNGDLVGIVSAGDLSKPGRIASDVMTTELVTVSSSCQISRAVSLLVTNHISCLPVIDGAYLKGIATTTDLLMAFECFVERFGNERENLVRNV